MTSKEQLIHNCKQIALELESTIDLYEYVSSLLEINYLVDSGKRYLGAELLVSYGGPTIRILTRYNLIVGTWGMDKFETTYSNSDLDEILEEYYNTI